MTRKRDNGEIILEIEVSAKGRVSVMAEIKDPRDKSRSMHIVASLVDNDPYSSGNEYVRYSHGVTVSHLAEFYAQKLLRRALVEFFPGYTRKREEWTHPLRPVNERPFRRGVKP